MLMNVYRPDLLPYVKTEENAGAAEQLTTCGIFMMLWFGVLDAGAERVWRKTLGPVIGVSAAAFHSLLTNRPQGTLHRQHHATLNSHGGDYLLRALISTHPTRQKYTHQSSAIQSKAHAAQ